MSPTIALEIFALLWNPKSSEDITTTTASVDDDIIIGGQLSSSPAATSHMDDNSMPPLNVVRASQVAWSTVLSILSATMNGTTTADEDEDTPVSSSSTSADNDEEQDDNDYGIVPPTSKQTIKQAVYPSNDVVRLSMADPAFTTLCSSIVQVDLSALTFD